MRPIHPIRPILWAPLLAALGAMAVAADNVTDLDTYEAGTRTNAVLATVESGGVHVPVVSVASAPLPQGGNATVTSVSANGTAAAANPSRVELVAQNVGTARAYLMLGGNATANGTYSVVLEPALAAGQAGGTLALGSYTGSVGVAFSGNGTLKLTEVTR
jgi:hypothetical protein